MVSSFSFLWTSLALLLLLHIEFEIKRARVPRIERIHVHVRVVGFNIRLSFRLSELMHDMRKIPCRMRYFHSVLFSSLLSLLFHFFFSFLYFFFFLFSSFLLVFSLILFNIYLRSSGIFFFWYLRLLSPHCFSLSCRSLARL